MRTEDIWIDSIEVGNRLRPINQAAVDALAESMARIGLLQPITIYSPNDEVWGLVTGAHRLAAAKKLEWEWIAAVTVSGGEIDRELMEIAENLHRADLSQLDRDTQVARWIELTAAKQAEAQSLQLATIESRRGDGRGHRAEGGVNAAARELGIDKYDAHRAVKVAGLSDEAKRAARDAKLDDNRSALLAVAKETTPGAQVAKVGEIAAAKSRPKDIVVAADTSRVVKPCDRAEAMSFVTAIRNSLAVLDPIFDRIRKIGEAEFLELIGESEASKLEIMLSDDWGHDTGPILLAWRRGKSGRGHPCADTLT